VARCAAVRASRCRGFGPEGLGSRRFKPWPAQRSAPPCRTACAPGCDCRPRAARGARGRTAERPGVKARVRFRAPASRSLPGSARARDAASESASPPPGGMPDVAFPPSASESSERQPPAAADVNFRCEVARPAAAQYRRALRGRAGRTGAPAAGSTGPGLRRDLSAHVQVDGWQPFDLGFEISTHWSPQPSHEPAAAAEPELRLGCPESAPTAEPRRQRQT
jgi:hypothetical protein